MYNIVECKISSNCLKRFWLLHNQNIMGAITLYLPNPKNQVVIDIFIEEEFQNKWLRKHFAVTIKTKIIEFLKRNNITAIYSKAINSRKSPRLLAFFGFIAYNNVYYKLFV